MRTGLWMALGTFMNAVLWMPVPLRAAPKLVSVKLAPPAASLGGANASQRFLLLGQFSDGLERDLTAMSKFAVTRQEIATVDASGRLTARADGDVVVSAEYGGKIATSRIHLEGTTVARPFSFARDIGPILTRRGCNSSDCHGSVKGKAGLKLSVDALVPRDDYKWIVEGGTFQVLTTDEGPKHPRINVKDPEKSLLLLKPTMSVPHGGGRRFSVGSDDYQAILKWVRSGVPYGEDEGNTSRVTSVNVYPKEVVLEAGGKQQLVVEAHFSDGQDQDITDQVLYVSSDAHVAKIDEGGLIQAGSAGETAILVRTAGFAVSAVVGIIAKPIENYPLVERRNLIDEFVFSKLRRFNIVPSSTASDSELLRRVCLDLTGTLPPPERVREFLAGKDPRKRDKLIEILLNSPEYVDFWTFRFSDLFRVTHLTNSNAAMTQASSDWIRASIAANKPYDQMARDRITAQGFTASGRSYYHISELLTPQEIMAEQVRVFLGRRLDCAQCHNHPYENWTQNQFWQLTAFYGRITEIRDSKAVFDSPAGGRVNENEGNRVVHPRTKAEVSAAFLDGASLPTEQRDDPRQWLAERMIASPYFSEAAVNRIWGYFFSRGIVQPVDDFRTTNPPSHPELLKALANDFREHGFDLKHLMRLIVQSHTYQLSSAANDTNRNDRTNYSRALPRKLEAAVLLDAISRVTAVDEDFQFHKATGGGAAVPGALAVSMVPEVCPSQFLDAYGRSMRQAPPSGTPEPNLLQALHLWAGSTYTTKIGKPGGRVDHLLQSGASDRQVVDEFYLAALGRSAEPGEMDKLLSFMAKRPDRRKSIENFVWALLSSREFTYNH